MQQEFKKSLKPFIQKWKAQLTQEGIEKTSIGREVDFQLTKRMFKLPGYLDISVISKDVMVGITKCLVKKAEYCEAIGCHELTNITAILHREPALFGYTSHHYVCGEHFKELKAKHVALDVPLESELTMKEAMDAFNKLEAKYWADEHKYDK